LAATKRLEGQVERLVGNSSAICMVKKALRYT